MSDFTPQQDKAQAPQQAAGHAPAREAGLDAPTNSERARALGFGTMPYPTAGSSTKIQGIDGFDPDVVVEAIVASTLASIGDDAADVGVLRAAAARVVTDTDRGRSGKVKALVGDRDVVLTVTTELRNLRVLSRGMGAATAVDAQDASTTGTGTLTARAGGDYGGVEASVSEARAAGRSAQSSLTLDALEELMRGDITTSWHIYHAYCPAAVVGAHPVASFLAAQLKARVTPPVFDSGVHRAGYLTVTRLVDE